MKKIFYLSILFISLWISGLAQKTCDMEFLNLVQTNETEFRFDVRIRNTTPNPTTSDPNCTGVGGAFALEGFQWAVDFNTAILNGGALSPGYYLYYLPYSSELATAILPKDANFGSDQTAMENVSDVITAGTTTTVLNHANWIKIGTFIVKLRDIIDDGNTPSKAHNFANVLPNIVPQNNSNNWIGYCTYNASTSKKTGTTTGISTISFINSLTNKPLYSHCFSGTDNYNTAANWNNNVDVSDASYHQIPPVSTSNVAIGSINYDEINSIDIATPGICTLTSTPTVTVNDLTIKSTSSLTMNAGTQLSVDGSLYNDNATAGALTLKADGGVHPTASLKNNTASVTATIENYIPAWGTDVGWHLLASPVNAQAIDPNFTAASGNYDFFAYDGSTASCWINFNGGTFSGTTFGNANGYLVSYASAATHNFAGTMHTGYFSPVVNFYTFPGTAWNLIGNPYASAIDGDLLTRTNLSTSVWVLDGPTNTYKVWNGSTGDLTNGEIPAMQGFWVEATGASPTVTIPVTAKIHSSANFLKSTALSNHLRINVQSPNITESVAFIYFKDENLNGLDVKDASLLPSGNPVNTQIYSYINSDKYCINALGAYTSPISVNLGFEPKVNGNFTLTAGDIQSFNLASHIYLQDLKTNTTQDLRSNPTYTFAADITDNVNRFTIFFDLVAEVGIPTTTAKNNGIYSFGDKLYLPTIEKLTTVSIYNMLGQEVVSSFHPTSNIFTVHQPEGYYIVRVIANQNVITQKIYIK
ncbi:MAG: T9SS type A sorting domain-containing protein [Bacteroidota bacterium]